MKHFKTINFSDFPRKPTERLSSIESTSNPTLQKNVLSTDYSKNCYDRHKRRTFKAGLNIFVLSETRRHEFYATRINFWKTSTLTIRFDTHSREIKNIQHICSRSNDTTFRHPKKRCRKLEKR
jgi:hypothetical protein